MAENIPVKTIAMIVGLIMTIGGVIWAVAHKDHLIEDTAAKVETLAPEVDKNTEARIGVERDIKYILKGQAAQQVDIDNNTVLLERILIEVTK